ncbi:hypothetical protein ACFPM0_02870 [Pseudonocardia sulfidoxydans]|uniref:hypothetical protein n=1 Tax=Pseudonocardia sulfidoxydans TaxID=54011 RepID=UPI003607E528
MSARPSCEASPRHVADAGDHVRRPGRRARTGTTILNRGKEFRAPRSSAGERAG